MIIAVAFVAAGLASLGLPGMSGFVAEFLVFIGSFPTQQTATLLGAFGIVITAGYLLWMLQRVFMGPISEKWENAHLTDASPREIFYVVATIAVIIGVGVYPSILTDVIGRGVVPMVARLASL